MKSRCYLSVELHEPPMIGWGGDQGLKTNKCMHDHYTISVTETLQCRALTPLAGASHLQIGDLMVHC